MLMRRWLWKYSIRYILINKKPDDFPTVGLPCILRRTVLFLPVKSLINGVETWSRPGPAI